MMENGYKLEDGMISSYIFMQAHIDLYRVASYRVREPNDGYTSLLSTLDIFCGKINCLGIEESQAIQQKVSGSCRRLGLPYSHGYSMSKNNPKP